MNKMTRKIMVSVLTLILTVVALGTTTFAWFTLSNVSTVSNISGTAQSGEGLQFKVVAKNADGTPIAQTDFVSHVDFDNEVDFKNFFANFVFKAVEYNATANKMETLGVLDNGDLYQGLATVKNTDYIELEFTFRSLTEGATVKIEEFTVTNENVKNFTAKSPFTGQNGNEVAVDDVITVEGKNALRLGLVGADDVVTPYYNGHGKNKDHGQFSYLQSLGVTIYDKQVNGDAVAEAPALPAGNYTEGVKVATLDTPENPGAEAEDFKYFLGTATIRIWLDGWDPHAYDPVFEQVFNINFRFELKA